MNAGWWKGITKRGIRVRTEKEKVKAKRGAKKSLNARVFIAVTILIVAVFCIQHTLVKLLFLTIDIHKFPDGRQKFITEYETKSIFFLLEHVLINYFNGFYIPYTF